MRHDITFTSNGNQLLGHLYLPHEPADGMRLPAVVVVGPASSTKGQVPAVYATRLSELGYAALAFDHTSYGESAGFPRTDEDPITAGGDCMLIAATAMKKNPDYLVAELQDTYGTPN